jgi:tight adherence protein C
MSELWLIVALSSTFSAVALAVVGVRAVAANRGRAVEMLRSQVVDIPDLRQRRLREPFTDRVVIPFVTGLGRFVKRVTPIGMRQRTRWLLVLAGDSPESADRIAAFRLLGAVGGAVLGAGLSVLAGLPTVWVVALSAFAGLFLYLLPGASLGQRAVHRQAAIRRAMPDTMDLLTISVEAGLGFDAALSYVVRNVPGPLSEEFARFLQEAQLGVSRADALRNLAGRTDIDELRAFTLAMIQADEFGISIAKVLRAQSKDLRIKRRQRAEEAAMKVPTKLLFPLIFGILPATFVVMIGPGAIQLWRTFFRQ